MNLPYVMLCILIMALVTYPPRMLPLVLFRRTIENRFIKSFLEYMPYAVLGAMTFPEVLFATAPEGGFVSMYFAGSVAGMLVALVLAYFGQKLPLVALGAVAAAFATQTVWGLLA